MTGRRQLITSDEAVRATGQHKKPCSDCPWARKSLAGWLGSPSADEWLREAHGDHEIPCHVLEGAQCAGSAIYRRNVSKLSLDAGVLRLDADRELVFASPTEFKRHHEGPRAGTPKLLPVMGKETEMPKGENVKANIVAGNLKAKHAEAVEKLKTRSAGQVAAAVKRGNTQTDRVRGGVRRIAELINKLAAVNDQVIPDAQKKTDRIAAIIATIRSVTDKHAV